MEIRLTPEVEALLVNRAKQHGQTPEAYATELLARDLSTVRVPDQAPTAGSASGQTVGNARRLSLLFEQEARDAPPVDLSDVLGAWGRSGHAVDGLAFEREQREEWP